MFRVTPVTKPISEPGQTKEPGRSFKCHFLLLIFLNQTFRTTGRHSVGVCIMLFRWKKTIMCLCLNQMQTKSIDARKPAWKPKNEGFKDDFPFHVGVT